MKKILIGILICMTFLQGCRSEEVLDDDSIVISLSSEPEMGFDPCLGWGKDGNPLIQSTLLATDSNMNFINDLATEYQISDDGLMFTFKIRDDVLFSNGEKLTASDVAFTYNTAKESASVIDLTILESATSLDDETVVFTLKKPQITFLNVVSQIGIVPEDYYNEDYSKNPIGSGPFTVLEWKQGEQIILGVNENYYGKKPEFSRVTILFMTDEAGYTAALNGDIDVALTNVVLAQNEIDGMELLSFDTIDNRGITLPTVKNEGLKNSYGYDIGNDVTSDVAIRQAISYGIDREQLIIDCINGYGSIAFSECDGMPWASEEAFVNYDLEYSKSILEDANWILADDGIRYKDGLKAEFTLLYNASDSTRQALSFAISDYLKELGILVNLKGTSWDEIEKLMHSSAVLMGWGSQNPMETYYLYHSSNKGVDYYNPEYFESEIIDSYLDKALEENDYDEFLKGFKSIQWDGETGVSAKGQAPFVWLVNVDHLYFVNENLDLKEQKIHPHGHSWPLLSNLNEWTWKEIE